MKQRKIYLDNYELNQAIELYLNDVKDKINLETEFVDTKDALGLVSAKAIYAKVSTPNYNASAMDGIPRKASLTTYASETTPVFINEEEYQYVNTGNVIKNEHDAVVMIEDVVVKDDNRVMLTKPVAYFENIRPIGEDITQTQMIIPSYHKIRAVDLGPLIASKNEEIEVFKKLKTAIMPTGNEIVDVSIKQIDAGMIIDSNSSMIKALCDEMNLDTEILPVTKDDYEILKKTITKVSKENDIILINAGSSAGSEDYTAQIIEELGQVSVHGIAIKPGKPAILGIINKALVIGLPGYPVSTYIVFEQVFKPIINKLFHQKNEQEIIEATLTKTIYSSLKHLEFIRVKVGYVNDKFVCTPLARGAGISMSLAEADGIIIVPKESEGYHKNDKVAVTLFKPSSLLKDKLTIIGSHDLIVDVLQDTINELNYPNAISSTHVGSYSGLLALKANECNLAPIHILSDDGTYNINVIKEMFKDEKMIMIKGVKRRQVLGYLKGNPKKIKSIKDLVRGNIKYVNRQKGSGTAILLDYLLKRENIDKINIQGYDFVMPSHFNVAAAIKNETVDCGLLIKSIADVMELDYFEVMSEDYDFVLYEKDLELAKVKMFIEVLQSDLYKEKLNEFDCYDTSDSGKIIKIG